MNVIKSLNDGLTFETIGFSTTHGYELSASVVDLRLAAGCEKYIRFVAQYLLDGNDIRSGETLAYGYWLTKAVLNDVGRLIFLEADADLREFVFGVSGAGSCWQVQHETCTAAQAQFSPILPNQMIVISDGVLD